MKEYILKLIGFDKINIDSMKTEIVELKTTINSLSNDLNNIHSKTILAFSIIKQLGIDEKNELWWENRRSFDSSDINTFILAERIKKDARIAWVEKYPTLKERKIFHGGCLGCTTPLIKGVGVCLGCRYLDPKNTENLSSKKH